MSPPLLSLYSLLTLAHRLVPSDSKAWLRMEDGRDFPNQTSLLNSSLPSRGEPIPLLDSQSSRWRDILKLWFYLRQISRNHWNGNWLSSCSEVRQNPSARSEPHSHRVLVFLMRRHRGESTEEAWKALANNVVDSLFSSTKDNAKNSFETLLKLDSRPRLSQQSSNNFFITS